MSVWASDDLASVIIRPDLEFAGWGQGVIEAWNPETFENVIQYRGSQHENLAVASGVEALTYQPGDVVMLSRWQPTGGGATTLRIGAGGRVIVPGTGAAEKTVAWMTSSLASRVALAVFGEAIHAAEGAGIVEVDAVNTWVSGGGTGTPPQISGVEVGGTGRCLVMLAARCEPGPEDGQLGSAYMGFEVSGATSVPPTLERAAGIGRRKVGAGDAVIPAGRVGATVFLDNLNPGTHDFAARFYQSTTGGGTASFLAMTLVVIPF